MLTYEKDEIPSFDEIYELSKKAHQRFLDKMLINNTSLKSDIFVKVNGKRVNIPSYSVNDGDEISLKDGSKEINLVQESIVSQEREIPEYIEVDFKKMTAKFIRIPELSDVPYPAIMEPNLVVEYYAKN